jgi:speckle-type POZ protein
LLTHSRARDRDTFTDFTLICGTDRHRVHKLVICTQSKVFYAACTGSFKEAPSNEFEMPEDDPAMVARMVEYLYSGRYEVGGADSATELNNNSDHDVADGKPLTPMRVHARMFALADKVRHCRAPTICAHGVS